MKWVYLLISMLCFGAVVATGQDDGVVTSFAVLENNNFVNNTIDFGFKLCEGVIGDLVWNDLNGDGIQNDGDNTGIAGAVVYLYDTKTGDQISDPVTTDINGTYKFEGLCAGNYTVKVKPPSANYNPTTSNVGDDDAVDSDGT